MNEGINECLRRGSSKIGVEWQKGQEALEEVGFGRQGTEKGDRVKMGQLQRQNGRRET